MLILYYNKSCKKCGEQANRTKKLDWFNRINLSTEPSPIGTPKKGEIIVVRDKDKKYFTGIYATREVCLNIPVYFIFGLLLYLPPILNRFPKDKIGCVDETSCNV